MFSRESYLKLLDQAFPGLKANIQRCEKIGFAWPSKPFVKIENNEVISHVGFVEYPIVIEGRVWKAGGLHAICTKPEHRDQGLASELIEEAIQWAENNHYALITLFTKIPKFYEKFSFKHIQEYRFRLRCSHLKGSQPLHPIVSPKDNNLFRRIFQERSAPSNRLWVMDDGVTCCYNTLFATYPNFWSLHYSPSLDAILSFNIEKKTVHFYDVIAKRLPTLEQILDHIPQEIEEIYFYFSPDRLTDKAVAEKYLFYDNEHFMVRGDWPDVKQFMISPLARC